MRSLSQEGSDCTVCGPADNERMVKARDIGLLRLVAQRIAGPGCATAADAVRWMTATQAQDYASAVLAVALRTQSRSRSEVHAALDNGSVVRSWPMRGTLHFVAAEDLPWMLALTAERSLATSEKYRAQLGLELVDHRTCSRDRDRNVVRRRPHITRRFACVVGKGRHSEREGTRLSADLAPRANPHALPRPDRRRTNQRATLRPLRRMDHHAATPRTRRSTRRVGVALLPQPRTSDGQRLHVVDPTQSRRREGRRRDRGAATRTHRRRRRDVLPRPANTRVAHSEQDERRARSSCCPRSTSTCWATKQGPRSCPRSSLRGSCPAATASSFQRSFRTARWSVPGNGWEPGRSAALLQLPSRVSANGLVPPPNGYTARLPDG